MRTRPSGLALAALALSAALLASCQARSVATPSASPASPATPTLHFSSAMPPASRPRTPPMSLTASDGSGLRLASLVGRAVIEEPLAFTELRLTFENPRDRIVEGNFSITLPPGATVSRFAMKMGELWQEGEVVERQAARRAYEDFLHKKQDPALLEQGAGNQFTARVFPIPARGVKELVVSYSQELTAATPYALPLRGLPEIGELDVALTAAGSAAPVRAMKETRVTPQDDLVWSGAPSNVGLRSGNLTVVRVEPVAASHPDLLASAVILVDTSASRALGFEDEVRVVEQVVGKMVESAGGAAPLVVGCFDQTIETVFDGKAGAFGAKEVQRIVEREALGASNLAAALAWAGEHAKSRGVGRVVLVSDGVATAGDVEGDKIGAAARKLAGLGVERIDVVALGGIRDDALLHHIVTAGLARDGVVADGTLDATSISKRLGETTSSGIDVTVAGARWSWPRKLDGVQAGDQVLVYAEVPEGTPVAISLGRESAISPRLTNVDRPLVERAWAEAKIASLLDRQGADGEGATTTKEIVALSTTYRVLSPYTALLVLETDADYARFNIDRRALADLITIDQGRLAIAKRTAPPRVSDAVGAAKGPDAPATAPWRVGVDAHEPPTDGEASGPKGAIGNMWGASTGDAFGAGGLGLSGAGEGSGQGFGMGHGRLGTIGHGAGAGAHQDSAPMIRQGNTQVSGRFPVEVVQRIVRQSFGRFRLCYENGLRTTPTLAGRVAVRFTIDEQGTVARAEDGGSTLGDTGVVACIVRGFGQLSFPRPDGAVTVVYPIVFAPGGGESLEEPSATDLASAAPVESPAPADAYTGRFKSVMAALARGDAKEAVAIASEWRRAEPGDVMALVALGEAFEVAGDLTRASRSYGSIVDLFSTRADLRRFAGERLERVNDAGAKDLALDTYAKAEAQRPDHPASHRLLAFAWLKKGEPAKAFDAAIAGLAHHYPAGRFAGVERVLREDLGLIAAAWMKAEPLRQTEILARLRDAGGTTEDAPSLRFVLNWETDANDVDFHIYDAKGAHAFYGEPRLASGGELYADVTTGYGPECFTIRGDKSKRSERYTLQAHYYSRGPMGYGMGKLEIIDHDGKGGITFEERPFVVMVDQAFVDLGRVSR